MNYELIIPVIIGCILGAIAIRAVRRDAKTERDRKRGIKDRIERLGRRKHDMLRQNLGLPSYVNDIDRTLIYLEMDLEEGDWL